MLSVVSLLAYVACVPFANWLIGHVGTVCVPHGPCLVPVGFGLTAPSGVLLAGLALVLRDAVQARLGFVVAATAVLAGAALSAFVAPPSLALASGAAFLISEAVDTIVYTPLRRRGLVLAVAASSVVGLAIDSVAFLLLAFGSLQFLAGQLVGKGWMVGAATVVLALFHRLSIARTAHSGRGT